MDTHQLALKIQQKLPGEEFDFKESRSVSAAVKSTSRSRREQKDYFIPIFVAVAAGSSIDANLVATAVLMCVTGGYACILLWEWYRFNYILQ
jgi:hypothetical protein